MGKGGIRELRTGMQAYAAAFDPDRLRVDDLTVVVREAARIEAIAATLVAIAAARVANTSTWKNSGYRSGAEWLANETGTTTGEAKERIATGEKLEDLDATSIAARNGDLSAKQTATVSDAAAANPEAETDLLGTAQTGSLGELRERARQTKADADPDPAATFQRLRAGRAVKRWVDTEPYYNLRLRTTIDDGARIDTALRAAIDDQFKLARAEGRHEPYEAYVADAVIALLTRDHTAVVQPDGDTDVDAPAKPKPARTNPKFMGLLRLDVDALRRGETEPGETCEIAGYGPIPVAVARDLLGDAILKLVITRGVDVINVTHLGRGATAAQQVALWWTSPCCTVAGCTRMTRLENDHRIPYVDIKATATTNLDPLCHFHHQRKTLDGWALIDGTGKRAMVPPDHADHPKRKHANAA